MKEASWTEAQIRSAISKLASRVSDQLLAELKKTTPKPPPVASVTPQKWVETLRMGVNIEQGS